MNSPFGQTSPAAAYRVNNRLAVGAGFVSVEIGTGRDSFKVECPTGSGNFMNLFQVGQELADRLIRTFKRNEQARRRVYGGTEKFQTDPYWRDHLLFYEYFHGDNGAGIGASHQTGWTGCIARMINMNRSLTEEALYSPGSPRKFSADLQGHVVGKK